MSSLSTAASVSDGCNVFIFNCYCCFLLTVQVCFVFADGPIPLPNMPNQIMSRMQASQGTFLIIHMGVSECTKSEIKLVE